MGRLREEDLNTGGLPRDEQPTDLPPSSPSAPFEWVGLRPDSLAMPPHHPSQPALNDLACQVFPSISCFDSLLHGRASADISGMAHLLCAGDGASARAAGQPKPAPPGLGRGILAAGTGVVARAGPWSAMALGV